MSVYLVWWVSLALALVMLTERWWSPRVDAWLVSRRHARRPWGWYLVGYPLTVARMRLTWRRLCQNTGLAVIKRPRGVLLGRDSFVMGTSLRPVPPWLGVARATRDGVRVRVRMHPGQTPDQYSQVAEAMAHAWRMHAVRVASPRKGEVELRAIHRDPLAVEAAEPVAGPPRRVLVVVVGRLEAGGPWLLDLRAVPHWLIIGATQSGKSTLLAALVSGLAPQPVALVGIDCKGGLALSPFEARLSALATDRAEAVTLLEKLVREIHWRLSVCRAAGVQSVWELPTDEAPLPVVVLVDELAELYLTDSTKESKQEATAASVSLVRLAQLGAALGVHLVVAGQRVGSELGQGVTALRAQLGGRVCHRVNDATTAEMALGDLYPDAVEVAQSIGEWERGVAVTTVGGVWARARSLRISPDEARRTAERYRHRTPTLAGLGPVHGPGSAGTEGGA